jgi:hypothetical protein
VRVVGRSASPVERRSRTARRPYAGASFAAVLLAGLIAALLGATGRAGRGVAQPGPAGARDGLPVGYADSRAGADAFAARFSLVAFGVLDGRIGASPQTIARIYATPAYRATLTALLERTVAQREAHASQLAQAVVHRTILATRLLFYTPQRASVETWEQGELMLGGPPLASSQVIQRFGLAREAGDWKLAGAGATEAQLARMTQAQQAEVLESFTGPGDASAGY